LRPSRFQDPGYWFVYLPIVLLVRFALIASLGLVAVASLVSSTSSTPSAVSVFAPTSSQRDAIRQGLTEEPSICTGAAVRDSRQGDSPRAVVSANDDGEAFSLATGDTLVVSYYQGFPPTFSPGLALCRVQRGTVGSDQEILYLATGGGSGYIYFPEQGGWAYVNQIEISQKVSVPLPLLIFAALVLLIDVGLWLLGRRVLSPRYR
jgi:hypothetical protein